MSKTAIIEVLHFGGCAGQTHNVGMSFEINVLRH